METLITILKALLIVISLVGIILILKQDAKEGGMGGNVYTKTKNTYFAKTGRKSTEEKQAIATGIVVLLYVLDTLTLLVLQARI